MAQAPYRLLVPDDVASFVRPLHPQLKRKTRAALQMILGNPEAGKPLKREFMGLRSLRVGRFRIVYQMNTEAHVVEIIAIGPRRSIYEETLRLVQIDEYEGHTPGE